VVQFAEGGKIALLIDLSSFIFEWPELRKKWRKSERSLRRGAQRLIFYAAGRLGWLKLLQPSKATNGAKVKLRVNWLICKFD